MKSFTCDELEIDLEGTIDAMSRNGRGEPLPMHRFPASVRGEFPDERFKKLPDICMAAGFWLLSSACAEVLRRFELGQTSLYPVKVFQFDGKTPVEGQYHHLNFGETKKAFEPEQTPNVSVASPLPNPEPTGYWTLPAGIIDGDVAVNEGALEGPDLWIDRSLPRMFFLSDALVQELKKAKLTRRFGLRKCRVVT